ncbi:MAG: type II secretion system F family protein [Micromonosporaceae bacterium]|nr:type II secretion system F family protein [Micromonosporaceae bacterium]
MHWQARTARASRRERKQAVGQLPIVADLLAAALRSGATPDLAALVVGEAVGGPVGRRLVRVARALRLGIQPAEAWRRLREVPEAERLARAAVRSAESGTMLAHSFARLGDDLRAARSGSAEAAARRAGVLGVLPLGLCFLPSFLLTGVVPVVLSLLANFVPFQ